MLQMGMDVAGFDLCGPGQFFSTHRSSELGECHDEPASFTCLLAQGGAHALQGKG